MCDYEMTENVLVKKKKRKEEQQRLYEGENQEALQKTSRLFTESSSQANKVQNHLL